MITETHYISYGQFLGQLEPFKSNGLPNKSIIDKITGCGATTLELLFHRNSIVIETNLPVIIGKCNKMNKGKRKHKVVLGVYDKIDVEQIKQYVANCKGYKKILTTPEGFGKVMEALGEAAFQDYFLLFDECEKVIQDVAYRGRITDPLDLFFSFKNKAFVSATPIIPSHPGFKDFTHVIIKPNYVYEHKVKVCPTNNIIFQLKKIIDTYHQFGESTGRRFFIFFKSTQRIRHIIEGLNLEDHSVFCSGSSAKEIKRLGISNAYDHIDKNFNKYNFFTSRFFSAVDFNYEDYKCDPIIIMISDPLAVEHTVIDPKSEAIQIIGRFREHQPTEGETKIIITKDIYHISNYNSKLTSFKKEEVEAILKDILRLHVGIVCFQDYSNTDYFKRLLNEILKIKDFLYYHRNSTPNYFMIDNFINIEAVKGSYQTGYGLIDCYKKIKLFNVDPSSAYQQFALTDSELREVTSYTALTKVNEFVSLRLKEIMGSDLDQAYLDFNLEMMRLSYPKQMAVIDRLSIDKASKFDYNIEKIQQQEKNDKASTSLVLIREFVKKNFELKGYTTEEIGSLLAIGIAETKLKGHTPNVKLLQRLAELSKRKNVKRDDDGNWQKGYEIIKFM